MQQDDLCPALGRFVIPEAVTAVPNHTDTQLIAALEHLAELRRNADPDERARLAVEADAVLDALAELER